MTKKGCAVSLCKKTKQVLQTYVPCDKIKQTDVPNKCLKKKGEEESDAGTDTRKIRDTKEYDHTADRKNFWDSSGTLWWAEVTI